MPKREWKRHQGVEPPVVLETRFIARSSQLLYPPEISHIISESIWQKFPEMRHGTLVLLIYDNIEGARRKVGTFQYPATSLHPDAPATPPDPATRRESMSLLLRSTSTPTYVQTPQGNQLPSLPSSSDDSEHQYKSERQSPRSSRSIRWTTIKPGPTRRRSFEIPDKTQMKLAQQYDASVPTPSCHPRLPAIQIAMLPMAQPMTPIIINNLSLDFVDAELSASHANIFSWP